MNSTVTEPTSDEPAAWITFFQMYGSYLAFPVALTAMLGSLYFSEIAGYVPCKLCWIQRILMYPLTIITLVGILKEDDYLPTYVLPFSILGMGVAAYHYMLQMGVIVTNSCGDLTCSSRDINVEGLPFITIPFLALVAFIMITVIMSLTQWAYSQMEDEE